LDAVYPLLASLGSNPRACAITWFGSQKMNAAGRRASRRAESGRRNCRPLVVTFEKQPDDTWRVMVAATDVGTLASPTAAKQFIEKIKSGANGRRRRGP
jgi:hypothetical protein